MGAALCAVSAEGAGVSGSGQQAVAVPLKTQLKTDLEGKNRTLSEDGKCAAPNPSLPTKGRPPALVHHGDLLIARVKITTYNQHCSAPFFRALVVSQQPSLLGARSRRCHLISPAGTHQSQRHAPPPTHDSEVWPTRPHSLCSTPRRFPSSTAIQDSSNTPTRTRTMSDGCDKAS